MSYAMKKVSKRDSLRRRMIIDRRARKYCDMIVRYYMDGILDTMRDKISALIAKVASGVKNPKFKKALLKISGAVAAGKMQKASIAMKKAAEAVKSNPAVVGGAAAAAAVGAGLTAAWKLSSKFQMLAAKGAMAASEGVNKLKKGAEGALEGLHSAKGKISALGKGLKEKAKAFALSSLINKGAKNV